MSKTRIELEQIKNSREYTDRLLMSGAAESGVDFQSDFNYVLSQVRSIIYGQSPSGTGNWYDAVPHNLFQIKLGLTAISGSLSSNSLSISTINGQITDLQSASGILKSSIDTLNGQVSTINTQITDLQDASGILSTELTALRTYAGGSKNGTTPTYSSTKYLTQNQSLTAGIGQLDAKLFAVSGNLQTAISSASVTLSTAFDNGNGVMDVDGDDASMRLSAERTWYFHDNTGANPVMTVSLSQILAKNLGRRGYSVVAADLSPGNTVTLPAGITYSTGDAQFRNLRVYRNGALQLPGSGVVVTDENFNDYREISTSGIITNRLIRENEVLEFHVMG